MGTIEAGKDADLVLLDANPLEDIHNTTKIRAVMAPAGCTTALRSTRSLSMLSERRPKWNRQRPTGIDSARRQIQSLSAPPLDHSLLPGLVFLISRS